jgi:hypothetical protein
METNVMDVSDIYEKISNKWGKNGSNFIPFGARALAEKFDYNF